MESLSIFHFLFLRVAAALICCCFFSCSPYGKIIKRNPLTHKDSVNLAKVCQTVYPNDTTGMKPDTVYKKGVIDSSYFYARIDSLKALKRKDSLVYTEIYKDTCTSAKLLYTEGYNDGVDIGYKGGLKDAVPDTVGVPVPYYVNNPKLVKIAEDKLIVEHAARVKAENSLSKWKTGFWYLLGFLVLLILAGFLSIRYLIKQKIKTVATNR
jgi:hypothetical protein